MDASVPPARGEESVVDVGKVGWGFMMLRALQVHRIPDQCKEVECMLKG